MKYANLSVLLFIALLSGNARGDSLPALTKYLTDEISRVSGSVAPEAAPSPRDEFFFRRWLLRLQATVGIDVPWVASFQVVPEVELVFQRPYPEGWTDYRPKL